MVRAHLMQRKQEFRPVTSASVPQPGGGGGAGLEFFNLIKIKVTTTDQTQLPSR